MAREYGILGQAAPSADTDTDLYAVPQRKEAEVKVLVANRDSSPATIRIWVAEEGATTDNSQYIAYDEAIAANEALTSSTFSVFSTDVVRVRASSGNISFTCTGVR